MKTASWPKKFNPVIIALQVMCRVHAESFAAVAKAALSGKTAGAL
ncbi:hypothetical protein [Caballeronia sordidicola]|nr:hypothetical protein [Caballeronia sordidicola]